MDKTEINRNINNIRNLSNIHLAHDRGRENAKGYGYEHSKLQLINNHKLKHKYNNMGRKNKETKYDIFIVYKLIFF